MKLSNLSQSGWGVQLARTRPRCVSPWIMAALVFMVVFTLGRAAAAAGCADQNLWLTTGRDIARFTSCGWFGSPPKPVSGIRGAINGLAADPADTSFWMSADLDRSVYHLNRYGDFLGAIQGTGFAFFPTGVAVDTDGVWLASLGGFVEKVAKTGGTLAQFSVPMIANPTGIAVDPVSQHLWLASREGLIAEYTTSGEFVQQFQIGAYAPYVVDLWFDPFDQRLVVTSTADNIDGASGASLLTFWDMNLQYQGTLWGGFAGLTGATRLVPSCTGPDCFDFHPTAAAAPPTAPLQFKYYGAAPSPFRSATTVYFDLASRQHVRVAIHDVAGRLSALLVDQELPAGSYRIPWDGSDQRGFDAAAGVYFVRVETSAGLASSATIKLR